MRAAAADQLRLLDLQALDTALIQLDRRERDLPERTALQEATTRLDALRATSAQRLGAVEDARADLRRLEEDAEVVAQRIARDESLILQSSSTKDVQGIESELQTLRRRRDELDAAQLEVMERLEAAEAEQATADAERDALAKEHEHLAAALQAQVSAIQAERARTQQRRDELAATIPADLVKLYDQCRERYGVGASELIGAVTSASGVTLTGSDLAAVRAADPDLVVMCPDSGAILVRANR